MSDKNDISKKQCAWPSYTIKPLTKEDSHNELVIVAECVTNFSSNFYNDFLKNKTTDLICPKLDDRSECVQKLVEIIKKNNIEKITTVKLDLKCCGYLTNMVEIALKNSGKNITLTEKIVDKRGKIKNQL